jgi:hypothetical protein
MLGKNWRLTWRRPLLLEGGRDKENASKEFCKQISMLFFIFSSA